MDEMHSNTLSFGEYLATTESDIPSELLAWYGKQREVSEATVEKHLSAAEKHLSAIDKARSDSKAAEHHENAAFSFSKAHGKETDPVRKTEFKRLSDHHYKRASDIRKTITVPVSALAPRPANESTEVKTFHNLREATLPKHVVAVSFSDPNHSDPSRRQESQHVDVTVNARDKDHALQQAHSQIKKKGHVVLHSTHLGLKEDVEVDAILNENGPMNRAEAKAFEYSAHAKNLSQLATRYGGSSAHLVARDSHAKLAKLYHKAGDTKRAMEHDDISKQHHERSKVARKFQGLFK